MDYKKTSILLKKIKSLHNTLMDNADHPSSIEKQLMESYLRDFYDSFVSGEGATDIFAEVQQKPAQVTESAPIIPIVDNPPIEIVSIEQAAEIPVVTEDSVISERQALENEDPVKNDAPRAIVEGVEAPIIMSTPEAKQEPVEVEKQAEAITDKEMVHDGKEIAQQLVNDPVDQDLLALFSESPITDLSDKLALLPIHDLTKALSINERFFTIQELFGGDSDLFQATLSKLNAYSDFNEASQELISSVATEFDWASDQKQKKAEHFIKLVRRRYQ